jgi:hypothetical protein
VVIVLVPSIIFRDILSNGDSACIAFLTYGGRDYMVVRAKMEVIRTFSTYTNRNKN